MILIRFFRFITGYINIIVEGFFIERFINICSNKGINIWNIKMKKSSLMSANVSIKDFKRIRPIAKKTKCRVKIKKKAGLAFLANKYKKRKVFAISLLLVVIFILFVSMFVWNIEIIASEGMSKQELEEQLKTLGLNTGILKTSLDTKIIENQMRIKRDDIAWIGIEIKGTNAIVNVVKVKKPEIINAEDYCNIVSNEDGIITKITVRNGTALVKENDVIKKGQMLVMGMIEGKNVDNRFVHSEAEIEAKVWRTGKVRTSLKIKENVRTGNEENKYQIEIKNFKINLYKNDTNFKMYDTISSRNNIKLFSNLYLPVKVIKNEYYETEEAEKVLTIEEAKNKAVEEARAKLEQYMTDDKKLLNENINFIETEEYIEAEVTWESLEIIGTKEKI